MANQLARPPSHALIPAQVAAAGADATKRFVEFFTANIRNRNTRAAYAQAVSQFFRWCEVRGLRELGALEPVHVAGYVEQLGKTHAAPSVKQHLAAVRMLFDWLVVGQIVRSNPASVVRGPKHVVNRGRTPILSPEEARALFESIPTDNLVGLRDRALIGVLIYSFARISAALSMRVEDYFPQGKRWWLRLHEKGGKNHEMPVHHVLEELLDRYVQAAGIGEDKKGWLFRAALARNGRLSERPMLRRRALEMIYRRAKAAEIATQSCTVLSLLLTTAIFRRSIRQSIQGILHPAHRNRYRLSVSRSGQRVHRWWLLHHYYDRWLPRRWLRTSYT